MGPFHILLDEMGLDQMELDKVGIATPLFLSTTQYSQNTLSSCSSTGGRII